MKAVVVGALSCALTSGTTIAQAADPLPSWAQRQGWTVVDMDKDWKIIYPFEKK